MELNGERRAKGKLTVCYGLNCGWLIEHEQTGVISNITSEPTGQHP
jgi:hypothetical protein